MFMFFFVVPGQLVCGRVLQYDIQFSNDCPSNIWSSGLISEWLWKKVGPDISFTIPLFLSNQALILTLTLFEHFFIEDYFYTLLKVFLLSLWYEGYELIFYLTFSNCKIWFKNRIYVIRLTGFKYLEVKYFSFQECQ